MKDHLAHLIAWQNGMTALLQFQPRWPAMGLTAEFVQQHEGAYDEMNHAIYEQHKDKPAETILALRKESDSEFRQTIDALSDEQLHRPYSHYQSNEPGEDTGEPIMNWVAGNIRPAHHGASGVDESDCGEVVLNAHFEINANARMN